MKKQVKLLTVTLLTLSILIPMTGCKKSAETKASSRKRKNTERREESENSEETAPQTLDTDSYDLVVPTGTIVQSDEPDLPEEFVYWDPTRSLKEEYTLEEALQKYSFVAGYSALVFTACEDLRMSHEFYCTDYGARRFQNSNIAWFLGPDGNPVDGSVTHADLKDPSLSTLSEFTENLGWLYVGNMGYYSEDDLDAPEITIVEETADHVFATVKKTPPYSEEGLYYAEVIDGKVFYTVFKIVSSEDELTEEDRQRFLHYSTILFEHLSPDDGTEPYLYDKLVNTPLLGDKHITGFDHIEYINGRNIGLRTKEGTSIFYCTLVNGAPDSYLEQGMDESDWVDADGMQMRENSFSGYQEFVFTIDDTRYLFRAYGRNDEKISVDSLDDLLALIEECCFIK
ncbi:MAG: hypothetical protein J5636_05695 [Clostridiales bacterium]|nr:hypothetical protein [Clostridiales bacterium]